MIVLRGPRGLLHLQRAGEPEAVRVDLGGVRLERLVPDREEVTARHPGGDLELLPVSAGRIWTPPLRALLEDLGVRRLQAAAEHLLVHRDVLRAVERDEVVELERLPGLTAAGVRVRVRGRLAGRHADLVR